jgi:hypothetical protein
MLKKALLAIVDISYECWKLLLAFATVALIVEAPWYLTVILLTLLARILTSRSICPVIKVRKWIERNL